MQMETEGNEASKNMSKCAPKVTIIMTTFNAEKHIEQSLQSALMQDIKDVEILCVDGHSTDRTLDIIQDLSKKDSRVRLVFQEHPGIGAAKNCGIEHAEGEYITFLDSDDFYMDPTALRKMYEICREENVAVCGAFRSNLFEDGRFEQLPLHRHDCKPEMRFVRLRYQDRQYDYHFHSYIYDRQMVIHSDARFAEVKAYDDTHFFIRAMLKAQEFCVVPVELYCYRHGNGYRWGMESANDAMRGLTDQLRLSREQGLATLHWLTLQRINYDYGEIFERNIRDGDFELLAQMIRAASEIDADMIKSIENNPPDEQWYLMALIRRRCIDMPLRTGTPPYAPPYIFEPLWRTVFQEQNQTQKQIQELQCRNHDLETRLQNIPGSIRKINAGILCLREHGIIYTFRIILKRNKKV